MHYFLYTPVNWGTVRKSEVQTLYYEAKANLQKDVIDHTVFSYSMDSLLKSS